MFPYIFHYLSFIHSIIQTMIQFSSVAQSCPTLWDPMDCSTLGLPVHRQLLEFTQTHAHWVGDAIQPSHPLSSPSPPLSIFPHIRVFSNESALHIRWAKYWSFSFNVSPSNNIQDWFPLEWASWISLLSKGPSRVFSNTTVQTSNSNTTVQKSSLNVWRKKDTLLQNHTTINTPKKIYLNSKLST